MGERRFVIIECSAEIYEGTVNSITKAELILRCNAIRKPDFITEDEAIDILLHG